MLSWQASRLFQEVWAYLFGWGGSLLRHKKEEGGKRVRLGRIGGRPLVRCRSQSGMSAGEVKALLSS